MKKVYFLFDSIAVLILLEIVLTGSLGWLEGRRPLRLALLLGLLLYFLWTDRLQKQGRWYCARPQPLWRKGLLGLLTLGNLFAGYTVAELRQAIWPHLVCFTLPAIALAAWDFRDNFPKGKEHP